MGAGNNAQEEKCKQDPEWCEANRPQFPGKLKEAKMKVWSTFKCSQHDTGFDGALKGLTMCVDFTLAALLSEAIYTFSHHLCAFNEEGHSTCSADSGGPLFLSENGRYVTCNNNASVSWHGNDLNILSGLI